MKFKFNIIAKTQKEGILTVEAKNVIQAHKLIKRVAQKKFPSADEITFNEVKDETLIMIFDKISEELREHRVKVNIADIKGFHQGLFWIQAKIKQLIESEKEDL